MDKTGEMHLSVMREWLHSILDLCMDFTLYIKTVSLSALHCFK